MGLVNFVRIEHQANGDDSLPDHEVISWLACELEVDWRSGLVRRIASVGDNQVGTLEVWATNARRLGDTRNKRRS